MTQPRNAMKLTLTEEEIRESAERLRKLKDNLEKVSRNRFFDPTPTCLKGEDFTFAKQLINDDEKIHQPCCPIL